jgi:L-ribulose-5-phosphate 4-epimerase
MTSKGEMRDLAETVAMSHRLMFLTGIATDRGHTSVRIPGTDRFIVKAWPHIHMDRTIADDLIIMDFEGNIVEGKKPTNTRVSEWPIHAEVYRSRPDVGSVIHTHQKWATMIGIAGKSILPVAGVAFSAAVAKPLPMFDDDRALIRRTEQALDVVRTLGDATACHLQNHGMVFAGPNVETVTLDAIHTEYQAELTWRAALIGTPEAIPSLLMQSAVEQRKADSIPEAWEHYWKWVDQHPESYRPRAVQL